MKRLARDLLEGTAVAAVILPLARLTGYTMRAAAYIGVAIAVTYTVIDQIRNPDSWSHT